MRIINLGGKSGHPKYMKFGSGMSGTNFKLIQLKLTVKKIAGSATRSPATPMRRKILFHHLVSVAAIAFGLIQGIVRFFEQGFVIGAMVRIQRYPDAE